MYPAVRRLSAHILVYYFYSSFLLISNTLDKKNLKTLDDDVGQDADVKFYCPFRKTPRPRESASGVSFFVKAYNMSKELCDIAKGK
jgi:hypothetical protein